MQSLADVLKVDRKALHYHVKDRQSLFELLARHTFSQRLLQTRVNDASDWKDACRIYGRDLAESASGLAELLDYLWFGDLMNDLPLEPVESMFAHLSAAGFTDEDAILQYASEVEAAAKKDGLPTQVYTLFHEHDEITAEEADAGDECTCIQYLQSHLPTYEWNADEEAL